MQSKRGRSLSSFLRKRPLSENLDIKISEARCIISATKSYAGAVTDALPTAAVVPSLHTVIATVPSRAVDSSPVSPVFYLQPLPPNWPLLTQTDSFGIVAPATCYKIHREIGVILHQVHDNAQLGTIEYRRCTFIFGEPNVRIEHSSVNI